MPALPIFFAPKAKKSAIALFCGALLPLCSAYAAGNLVGHWKFDETTGTTAQDTSGNANHGAYFDASGLTQTPNPPGPAAPVKCGPNPAAVLFTGVAGSHIGVASASSMEPAASLTIGFWIRPRTLSTGVPGDPYRSIISKKGPTLTSYGVWQLDNKIYVETNPVGNTIYGLTSNATLAQDEWAYVAFTFDGSTQKLYVNGALDSSQAVAVPAIQYTTSEPLKIGSGYYNQPFDGYVDELQIYDYALTGAELAGLFAGGCGPSVSAPGPLAPAATAAAGNAQAEVSWTEPDNNGSPVTGYVVTAAEDPSKTCTAAPPATSCLVTGLTNGTPYTFIVRADNANGAGTDSALAGPVTPNASPLPSAPRNPTAVAGNAQATVSWVEPAIGSPVTLYTVTAVEDPSKSCTATPPATSCIVPNLANGTPYTFTVRADNANGTGTDSTATAPVTPSAPPVPSAPLNPAAMASNGQATVSWNEPASGGPFTLYTVTSVEDPSKSCTATPPATSCIVTNLANGSTYTFRVRASNANGTGAASIASNAVTPQAPAPSAQTITFGPQAPQTYAAGGSFAIHPLATASSSLPVAYSSLTAPVCTVVSGATVAIVSAGTCTIAANQAGDGAWLAAAQVTQNVTIAKAAQTISFPAQAAKTYAAGGSFSLAATASSSLPVVYTSQTPGVCSVQGNVVTMASAGTCTIAADQPGDGNWNAAAQVAQGITINAITPGAPTNVQATPGAPGSGQATVRWTAPADTGAPITYTVRALVNGQPSGQTCTATSPATECTVADLAPGVTYTFSVEASNGAGNAAAPSNPVTPQAAVQGAAPIPTLSEWALLALSALMALAMAFTLRRQR